MHVSRLVNRRVAARALLGLVLTASLGLGVSARSSSAGAYSPRVIIYDNDGVFMPPGDPGTGMWGFEPAHIAVVQGEKIEFVNPAGNARPHTVTSITATGNFGERKLESGTKFDSSPTREQVIMPGSSFTLDTSSLDPGQYTYYCFLHAWMLGSITVMAPPSP